MGWYAYNNFIHPPEGNTTPTQQITKQKIPLYRIQQFFHDLKVFFKQSRNKVVYIKHAIHIQGEF